MTLAGFEEEVFRVALASPLCDLPVVRRFTETAISLRVNLSSGGFIEAFHNERTDTTAFALIRDGRRVFGADNTGGWHVHPFGGPDRHEHLAGAMAFEEFVAQIEGRAG
jgi:hypothetical protein